MWRRRALVTVLLQLLLYSLSFYCHGLPCCYLLWVQKILHCAFPLQLWCAFRGAVFVYFLLVAHPLANRSSFSTHYVLLSTILLLLPALIFLIDIWMTSLQLAVFSFLTCKRTALFLPLPLCPYALIMPLGRVPLYVTPTSCWWHSYRIFPLFWKSLTMLVSTDLLYHTPSQSSSCVASISNPMTSFLLLFANRRIAILVQVCIYDLLSIRVSFDICIRICVLSLQERWMLLQGRKEPCFFLPLVENSELRTCRHCTPWLTPSVNEPKRMESD